MQAWLGSFFDNLDFICNHHQKNSAAQETKKRFKTGSGPWASTPTHMLNTKTHILNTIYNEELAFTPTLTAHSG